MEEDEKWMTERLLSQVESVLSADQGMSRRDIHCAVDCYSPNTIKHLLRELVRVGRAKAEGEGHHRRWRRAEAVLAPTDVSACA